eukprot:CAMPEP_0170562760 /NCGR_PEP_ID=MMETSP0211-20121228/62340_1 /TAXON_ID=311385 /ORGANISM="Pseudokeronopsis sp., Strain OXSARD2" /LENGTH=71 /DNA_ID=CAMNT_0010880081 /DNA_START=171 /DNA_END=383 /DNA_ORIENTATION=+
MEKRLIKQDLRDERWQTNHEIEEQDLKIEQIREEIEKLKVKEMKANREIQRKGADQLYNFQKSCNLLLKYL